MSALIPPMLYMPPKPLLVVHEGAQQQLTGSISSPHNLTITTGAPSPGRTLYFVIPCMAENLTCTFEGNPVTEVFQANKDAGFPDRARIFFGKIADDVTTSGTLTVTHPVANTLGASANVFSVYNESPTVVTGFTNATATGDQSFSLAAGRGDAVLWGAAHQNSSLVTVTSTPSRTVTENYDLDLSSSDFHAAGWISPADMTAAITSLTRNLTSLADSGATGAIVLTPA